MSFAKHSISDQRHKLVCPTECSCTSCLACRPASHNNPTGLGSQPHDHAYRSVKAIREVTTSYKPRPQNTPIRLR